MTSADPSHGANMPTLTLADLRPEVATFALAMERKLRANDAKKGARGWKGCDPQALLTRVMEEVEECDYALRLTWMPGLDPVKVQADLLDECADVANMAMMVADAAGALPMVPNAPR
jgi:NTP pyrophosphatase (non-canonical NTP hydrolase)